MVASDRWLRWLAWALVVLSITSAAVSLLFALGILLPPHDAPDFVDVLVANRASDTEAFPFLVIRSVATGGVFLVVAMLGIALRAWAPAQSLRDGMTTLLVIGGVIGIGANLLSIGVGQAATYGYCDCGYRAEEVIALNYALAVGRTVFDWLSVGAVALVGVGLAVAGRIIDISPAWRTLSYLIAVLLLLAVALRVIALFVFVEAIDRFHVSDLMTAVAAGILVPIWAILLARGAANREPDVATA